MNKPNLLDLYIQYRDTQDLYYIQEMTLHPHTQSCARLFIKNQKAALTLTELQSELFIRLCGCLNNTVFDKEYKLKAYIKQIIRGIILSASTRDKFKNTITTYEDITELDSEHYDTYEVEEAFPPCIQALFDEYPFVYDHLIHHYTITELQKKYNMSYVAITKPLKECKALIKEYYELILKL